MHGRSPEFLAVHSSGGCVVEIADQFILNSQALEHEMALISQFGRREFGGLLVNKTDGGDGPVGAKHSPEHRAKIGAAHRGRVQSPEWIERRTAANRGRIISDASKAKMSASHVGVKLAPQHAANAAAATRMIPPRADNTSGFKGVSLFKSLGKWRAYITTNGKQSSLGLFATPEDAARAYDEAAVKMWGAGNCYLNFPPPDARAA